MERLTVNKPVEEMGMYELAHNCCYAGGEGAARYRDFDADIDARDFARNLMVKFGLWKSAEEYGLDADNELIDDDIFDDTMFDNLQFAGINDMTIEGLITLFYHKLWAMADLHAKLKLYEDAEEQGLLLRLPCKIGDDVYLIPSKVNYDLNVLSKHEENNRVYHQNVDRIIIFDEKHWYMECDKDREYGTGRICIDASFGETWFLTKEEAEQALAKMKEGV